MVVWKRTIIAGHLTKKTPKKLDYATAPSVLNLVLHTRTQPEHSIRVNFYYRLYATADYGGHTLRFSDGPYE
jgi:hypothetical protein